MNTISPRWWIAAVVSKNYFLFGFVLLTNVLHAYPADIYFNNVDNGGNIGFNQTVCFGEAPSILQNLADASGGDDNLAIEYLWMRSYPNTGSGWSIIDGATDATYDPGILSQTTAFMRCARRAGFTNFTAESNFVVITVLAPPIPSISEAPVFGITDQSLNFAAAYLPFVTYLWDFGDGNTATGTTVSHSYLNGDTYDVTLTLTDQTTNCSITIPVSSTIILGPLPVEFSYFNAVVKRDEIVELYWATATEENNARFVIQHSDDGKTFTDLGGIAGSGTTTSTSHYTYLHDTPFIGSNYYRLKQVDLNGSYAFSEVINVNLRKENALDITTYPNPFTDQLFFRLKTVSELPVEITLYNTNHQAVAYTRIEPQNAKTSLSLSLLAPGFYIVKVKARHFHYSSKVLKVDL